jgi:hypothetical protein
MLFRVPLAVGLILGLLLAPPVARARLLCRWTGEEMSVAACQDRVAPEPGVSADEPCCEQRIQTPLPTAKLGPAIDGCSVSEPVLTELAWFETSQTPVPEPPVFASPPPGLPPLSATRILLI